MCKTVRLNFLVATVASCCMKTLLLFNTLLCICIYLLLCNILYQTFLYEFQLPNFIAFVSMKKRLFLIAFCYSYCFCLTIRNFNIYSTNFLSHIFEGLKILVTGEPLITATFWPAASGVSPCQVYGQLSLKKFSSTITFSQRQNNQLVLSQCLILPLLTVKQETFSKKNERKQNKKKINLEKYIF